MVQLTDDPLHSGIFRKQNGQIQTQEEGHWIPLSQELFNQLEPDIQQSLLNLQEGFILQVS